MPVIYQTDAELPSFAGINQSTDGYNMSLRFAEIAYNADVTGGSLAPMRDGLSIGVTPLDKPIETLARLHRRFVAKDGERDVLVAISDGNVYTKLLDHDDAWVLRYSGLKNNRCSWVTYEINPYASNFPVDVLIFTNADDGMFILYGHTLVVERVDTPYKFGVIERYNERIWGAAITDDPDTLVYSAPYDPLNWKQNDEIPEDGAGLVMQPSWDGDSFVSLKTFGSYLLAFKKNAVWKIYGTNPGEYIMKEQYGMGALIEDTIAVTSTYALMLGWSGIVRYDGSTNEPFQQQIIRNTMARLNDNARQQCCAVMDGKRYLLAIPLDDSPVNNAVIHYNITERTWSVMAGVYVKSFLAFDDRVFYTSSIAPGDVLEFGKGEALPVAWVSGYQDIGQKSTVKSNFSLYFTMSGEKGFIPMTFRIRTEKKEKEKFVMVEAGKAKRININASGRFFRLEIICKADTWWQMNGGIQIHCELDPD